MFILPDRVLGFVILGVFALQGVFVLFSPGSLRLQKPEGGLACWVYNVLNLSTLLVLTPLVAASLVGGWSAPLGWFGIDLGGPAVHTALGWAGLVLYLFGNLLMCWARVVLGRSFRLGAVRPDESDKLIVGGPFRLVRHPMYTAVLCMAVGMALAARSWVFLAMGLGILATFAHLIPVEEGQLREAYGEAWDRYAERSRRLVPFLY